MQKQITGGILVFSLFLLLGAGCGMDSRPDDINEDRSGFGDYDVNTEEDNEHEIDETVVTPPVVENQIALPIDPEPKTEPVELPVEEPIVVPIVEQVPADADDFSAYEDSSSVDVCGYDVSVTSVNPYSDLGDISAVVSIAKNGTVISSKKYMEGSALKIGACNYVLSAVQAGMSMDYASFTLQ